MNIVHEYRMLDSMAYSAVLCMLTLYLLSAFFKFLVLFVWPVNFVSKVFYFGASLLPSDFLFSFAIILTLTLLMLLL